jgi:hypothetical protein
MTGWTDAARKASAAARAARAKGKTQHAANVNKAVATARQMGMTPLGSRPTPPANPPGQYTKVPNAGYPANRISADKIMMRRYNNPGQPRLGKTPAKRKRG